MLPCWCRRRGLRGTCSWRPTTTASLQGRRTGSPNTAIGMLRSRRAIRASFCSPSIESGLYDGSGFTFYYSRYPTSRDCWHRPPQGTRGRWSDITARPLVLHVNASTAECSTIGHSWLLAACCPCAAVGPARAAIWGQRRPPQYWALPTSPGRLPIRHLRHWIQQWLRKGV